MIDSYVTNTDKNVYALKGLPPEVVAVLFGRYSRNKGSLRDILAEMAEEESFPAAPQWPESEKIAEFHKKWVVGFGHASVAEHAMVNLALENISIFAAKAVEDTRLGGYTEKSTRFVSFSGVRAHVPGHIRTLGPDTQARYEACVGRLFEFYDKQIGSIHKDATAAERKTVLDRARYALPAGTLTSMGVSINARALAHMLSKLLAHPSSEVRDLAEAMHREASKVVPSLLSAVKPHAYLSDLATGASRTGIYTASVPRCETGVQLVDFPQEGDAIAAIGSAARLDHSGFSLMVNPGHPTPDQDLEIINAFAVSRSEDPRSCPPPRCFETVNYTFNVLMDYGAYRDLQRHRMCAQFAEVLHPNHGFVFPDGLTEEERLDYNEVCVLAELTYRRLVAMGVPPVDAALCLPLGYIICAKFSINLRELCKMVELRSGKAGHISYRRVAVGMFDALAAVHPVLARCVNVCREGI